MRAPDRHRPILVPLAALLAAVLVACAATPTDPTSTVPTTVPSGPSRSAPSAVPSVAAPTFPITIADDDGTAVEIVDEPQRIVSLTPANTEIVFAVGAGDRLVATDSGSDYPADVATLPDVADFGSVDIEQIVGLEADLVLAGGLGFTPEDAITRLRELDIPVLVLYAPTVEGVYEDIELVGDAVGASAEGATLVTELRTEMDAIANAVAGAGTAPRVFYEAGYTPATGQIYGPAQDSFLAEMVTLAGGDVITTGDPANYEIPLETLIEQDPEVILLGTLPTYMPTPEEVAARPGWEVLTAVKAGAVKQVSDVEVSRPGPRLPVGLRNLASAIWPNVELPAGS